MMKWWFDRVMGAGALVVLAVPLGVIAIAVMVLLPTWRPIFCQVRIGLHGKRFTIYKFRTMSDDSSHDNPAKIFRF